MFPLSPERRPPPGPFQGASVDPEIGSASRIIMERLVPNDGDTDSASNHWLAIYTLIDGFGYEHGREVLKTLSTMVDGVGRLDSTMVRSVIEQYCQDHALNAPSLPHALQSKLDDDSK